MKAESVRKIIEELNPHGVKVTISIGLAQFDESKDDGFSELLKRADDALYKAKDQGRNRVVIG